jgi:hypothetical protein
MKGVYGSEGNDLKCPNCGSPCGAKTYCQDCGTQGCANCIGGEKPYDCNECGKGPVIFID